jgi:hypothetical protein
MRPTAFFMHKFENRPKFLRHALSACVLLLCACSNNARDYGFEISELSATISSEQASINSRFSMRLSDAAQLALERGIPLTLRIHFRARKDSRLPGGTIATAQHVYKLSYLPLSEHYALTDMVSGAQQTFPRLRYLISVLQDQDQVIPLGNLAPGSYLIQVRAELDLRKLPAPMRLPARIAPEWRLSTDWQSWPFDIPA